MAIKIYTVTVNGLDNGNTIVQPFTVEVLQVVDYSEEGKEMTKVITCTKNATGICGNDDIPIDNSYDLQGDITRGAALTATIETDLDTKYGSGNWS